MSHSPSSTDLRIGIEAAVHMRDSSSAFAFLQRIQHQHQQRQLSENSLDGSVDSSMNLDSGVFYSVMNCALQMGDGVIVQRTFDELKATVGVSGLEPRAWTMLLQVRAQEALFCTFRKKSFVIVWHLTQEFQSYGADGNHRRCVSIIAEMEVLTFACHPHLASCTLYTYLPQACNCPVDAAAYGGLLYACAMSPDVSPPHDWALSTLETMQVLCRYSALTWR